ncbi:MAG TPA: hypothetical protein DER01_17080 [Phycisphaerales bacterium]|nr:hypothetical protein [Phycisphaerales bacterium]
MSHIIHGAAGLAKAKLGIDRASDGVIEHRTQICKTCPKSIFKDAQLRKCSACGCGLIDKKLVVASEKCPLGKWDAVTDKPSA